MTTPNAAGLTPTDAPVLEDRIYQRTKHADKELKELVGSTGTTLMDLHGIGPSGAARLLVEVGDITRFPNRAHLASWNGSAPIRCILRRTDTPPTLPRRQPTDQPRAAHHGHRPAAEGRAYFDRRRPPARHQWKPCGRCNHACPMSSTDMINDAGNALATGPGGHRGTTTDSSVTSSHPQAGSSEKSLPGPAKTQLRTPLPAMS